MAYIPLDLPPGLHSNDTVYQSAGLWRSGDRIRWQHGTIVPIGGWNKFNYAEGTLDQVLTDPANERARAMLTWRLNDGATVYVIAHNGGLKAFNRGAATVYDITPASFVPQPPGFVDKTGYGYWFYGNDAYGTSRPQSFGDERVFNWCLRNWGQSLLAAPRGAQSTLYEWDATLANIAVPVANAPTDFDCFHVSEQRIVIMAGSPLEPRKVQWSDSEDNTSWTPQTTNQAGSQTLPGLGRFVEILPFRDQYLIISETDVHSIRYIGPPYIHSFDQVGQACGCFAGAAVVSTDNFVVWPGTREFFIYDGSVRRLECTVLDHFAATASGQHLGKMTGFTNELHSEVWWFYQSQFSDEVDSYIAWNFKEDHWFTGTLPRTVAGGSPVLGGPFMMGDDGYLYEHEKVGVVPTVSGDASEIYIESGPIETKAGDRTQYIDAIQPDFEVTGDVNVTLIGQDRPTGPETRFGPYPISYPATKNQPIPARARGHTIRAYVEGSNSNWSLGRMRLNLVNGGGRK